MDTVAATQAQLTTNRPAAGGPTPDGAQAASFLDLLFAAQAGTEGTPFAGMLQSESSDASKTLSALDPRGGEGMPAAHFLDMLLQGASPTAVVAGLAAGTSVTAPGGTGTEGPTAAPGTTTTAGTAPTGPTTALEGAGAGIAATGTTSPGATAGAGDGAAASATPATAVRAAAGLASATQANAAVSAGTGGSAPQTRAQQAAVAAETAIVQASGAGPTLPVDAAGDAAKAGVSVAAIAAGTTTARTGTAGTNASSVGSANASSAKPGASDASTAGQTSAVKVAGTGLRVPEVAMVDRPQPGADYASLARADQAAFADAEAARQTDSDGGFERLLQGTHGTDGGRGALGGPPTVSGAATPRAVHIPVPPVNQVAVQIATAARNGVERISLQLDPAELGRIDVSLDIAEDGHVTARVTADRPETLDMLQRDSRGLEKALQDAGLKMGGDSLSFDLREQGERQPSLAEDSGRGPAGRNDEGGLAADSGAMDAAFRHLDSSRALDIRV